MALRIAGAEQLDEMRDTATRPEIRCIDADLHADSFARGGNERRYCETGPWLKASGPDPGPPGAMR